MGATFKINIKHLDFRFARFLAWMAQPTMKRGNEMSRPFEVSKFQKSAPSLNFTRTFVVGRAIYSHPGGSSISLPVIVPLIPPFCRGFSIAVWLPEGTRSSECYCDIIAIDKSIRLEEVFRFTMTLKYGMVEFKTKRIPEVQYRSAPTEVNTQDWRVEN